MDIDNRKITQSDLYLALEDLVIYTLRRQIDAIGSDKSLWSSTSWAAEHCTIRFKGPRQSGHSTFVAKLCKYIFRNPLIIAITNTEVGMLSNLFQTKAPKISTLDKIHLQSGMDFDGIIVDNTSLIEPYWIEEIYRIFGPLAHRSGSFCFVFLG